LTFNDVFINMCLYFIHNFDSQLNE